MLTTPLRSCALALIASTLACDSTGEVPAADTSGGDQVIVPHLDVVETTVLPAVIPTGGSTTITCAGRDQMGNPFVPDPPLTFEVFDANDQLPAGVTIEGNRITAQYAGVIRVRCYDPGPPRVDDLSPVNLTVQPGEPASIRTTILKTDITAGDRIGVACSVLDALGNSTTGETVLRITPDTGTTVTGGKNIRFTAAGTFGVTCLMAPPTEDSLYGNTVDVSVSPDAIADIQTVLSRDTIAPTEEVTVTCPGTDRFGNAVALDKVITLPVDGITGIDPNRLRITGTQAGVYPITCAPKEAFVKATYHPASLTVVAGAAAALTMDLDPDQTVYALGQRPKVTARLVDAWGNEVADASGVTITARLGGNLMQTFASGQRAILDAEGAWTLVAELGDLVATRTLLVDASAPTIDITYPDRGAMITNGGGPVTVTGIISDATGGLASVKVNGTPRNITQGQNRYELTMQVAPHHGLNTLTVEATDVQGQTVRIAQSYMLAPGWKSAVESFADGIIARLTRAFIDDGNRQGRPDDLATIIERVVQGMDVASYIPSPVVQYAGYDVFLRNVRYDPPRVQLSPSRDLLNLHMDITNLSIDVDAEGFIDVSGVVTADAISVDVQLGVTVQQGTPKVTAQTISVIIDGLDIDVHWSINWLIDLFTDTIRESVVSSFEDVLRAEIPPAVQGALASLALDQSFQVPGFLPGMAPLNVRLQAKPNNAVVDEKGLDVRLATQVTAAKKVQWSTPGSLVRGGCFGADLGTPTWNESKKMTMALSLDVLNQVLHAVWQGGALEMSLGAAAFGDVDLSQYGVSDLSLDLSARMPPVLTDCEGGVLKIQLGELHLDADLKLNNLPMSVDMIVAFETTADVTVDASGKISIALGEIAPEDILIDITRVESDLFTQDQEDVLIALLRDQLLSKVLGDFGGQGLADFPLPEFDLGGLAPSLQGQVLSIQDVTLGRGRGYLLLEGNP